MLYTDTHNTWWCTAYRDIYNITVVYIIVVVCDVQNTLQSRFPVVKTKIDARNIQAHVHTITRCLYVVYYFIMRV